MNNIGNKGVSSLGMGIENLTELEYFKFGIR
jgi:hypothetical protein